MEVFAPTIEQHATTTKTLKRQMSIRVNLQTYCDHTVGLAKYAVCEAIRKSWSSGGSVGFMRLQTARMTYLTITYRMFSLLATTSESNKCNNLAQDIQIVTVHKVRRQDVNQPHLSCHVPMKDSLTTQAQT